MHRWAEGDGDPLTRFAWADEFEPSRGKNELFSQGHESKLLIISAIDCAEGEPAVTRTNMLYLVIGALAVAVAVLGYQLYQARHQPEGVHIELGPGGLSIEGNKSK